MKKINLLRGKTDAAAFNLNSKSDNFLPDCIKPDEQTKLVLIINFRIRNMLHPIVQKVK